MPVAEFYLTHCSEEQQQRLLEEGSVRYAAVLGSPLDRVRLFIHRIPPSGVAVAGKVVADSGRHSPYFTALMLHGRPTELRHRLLSELTDLLSEVLDADKSLIRGMITEVDPDGWASEVFRLQSCALEKSPLASLPVRTQNSRYRYLSRPTLSSSPGLGE